MTNVSNAMRPIHPGEFLREKFLHPMKMTAHALAMALQVSAQPSRRGRRSNGGRVHQGRRSNKCQGT